MSVLCTCSWRTTGMGTRLQHWSLGLNWSVLNPLQLSVCAVVVVPATEAVVWLPSHAVLGNLYWKPYQGSLYHDQLSGMTCPSFSPAIDPDMPPVNTLLHARTTCKYHCHLKTAKNFTHDFHFCYRHRNL